MKKSWIVWGFALSLLSCCVFAQVERSQLTSGIDNREPIDNLSTEVNAPEGTVKKIYFFTQIKDMANKEIIHRWIYKGDEKAAIILNVGSDDWRTYSSKNIPWQWQGQWEVQVWHEDLQLTSFSFNVSNN